MTIHNSIPINYSELKGTTSIIPSNSTIDNATSVFKPPMSSYQLRPVVEDSIYSADTGKGTGNGGAVNESIASKNAAQASHVERLARKFRTIIR
jgi:hypothetical protein